MAQRDVVLRWIEQVAKVIQRLLYGPGPVDLDLAAEHLEAAIAQHLGALSAVLPRVDVATGARLLHNPERIFGYAQLLGLRAAVQFAKHDPGALATHVTAMAFAQVAVDSSLEAPDSWGQWLTQARLWYQQQTPRNAAGAS